MAEVSTPLFECLSYNCTRVLWAGIKQKLRSKVDAEEGKSLISDDLIAKLNGMPTAVVDVNDAVRGVKGNAEFEYRIGNVNITAANIGLGNVSNLTDANRSVGSAAILTTARAINGIKFKGDEDISNYGYSETAADTQTKAVLVDADLPAELSDGINVVVMFKYANSVNAPKLNVNSTGAFEIHYRGQALSTSGYNLQTNAIYNFVYEQVVIEASDPSEEDTVTGYWNIVGELNDIQQTLSYTSGDTANPASFATVGVITDNEALGSVLAKLSSVAANVRYLNSNKAASSHTHGASDINSVNASAITGTISIDNLPASAIERLVPVANQAARFALTTDTVQLGDTVKQQDTGKMYYVVDESNLNNEDGYEPYTAGSASSVPWSGITGVPATFTPSAHSHTTSDIPDLSTYVSNRVSAMIAGSGSSATINGTATNGNVCLNIISNGSVVSSTKISGSGATTVTTNSDGDIIITSTDNNTTALGSMTGTLGYNHGGTGQTTAPSGQILVGNGSGFSLTNYTPVIISDTAPSNTNALWVDTSAS